MSRRMSFRCAPSARRIPISRVRPMTEYEIKPYKPIMARTRASVASRSDFELAHQGVVFGVGDLGLVEHIVQTLVPAEFVAELFDFARGILHRLLIYNLTRTRRTRHNHFQEHRPDLQLDRKSTRLNSSHL